MENHGMQNKSDTICLLYTTYHSFIWDLISEQFDHQNLVVVNFSKRKIKSNTTNKIIERTQTNKASFLLACLAIASASKFKRFNLVLPHPDHLLGNTLFFSKNAKNITLLEDGILNYYNYERAMSIEKQSIKRKRLTSLTPFRYKLYSGHHSGVDDCPTPNLSGWFTDPDKIIKKEKFSSLNKINFPACTDEKTQSNGTAILLEQPLEKFLNATTAHEIRKKTISFIENNFQKVIIKPHPEHSSIGMKLQNEVDFYFDKNIPIEEIILNINPDAVISYCSTALINISKISRSTRCIAIGINEISKELPETIKVKELFIENKVEIHQ